MAPAASPQAPGAPRAAALGPGRGRGAWREADCPASPLRAGAAWLRPTGGARAARAARGLEGAGRLRGSLPWGLGAGEPRVTRSVRHSPEPRGRLVSPPLPSRQMAVLDQTFSSTQNLNTIRDASRCTTLAQCVASSTATAASTDFVTSKMRNLYTCDLSVSELLYEAPNQHPQHPRQHQ